MFCGNCGNPLDEDAKFCGVCGTPVEQPTVQPNKRLETETIQVDVPAHGSGTRWRGIDIVIAVVLWIYVAFSGIAMFAGLSLSAFFSICSVLYLIIYLTEASIFTWNLRGEPDRIILNQAYLCIEAGTLVSLLLFILELILSWGTGLAMAFFIPELLLLIIGYFRLDAPKTLLSNPIEVLTVIAVFPALLQRQGAARKQIRARRNEVRLIMFGRTDWRRTVRLQMILGLCMAVLQLASMFMPMFYKDLTFLDYSVYESSISFVGLLMEELGNAVVVVLIGVLILACVAEIILYITGHAKLANIPNAVSALGAAFMIFLYIAAEDSYRLYYDASIGLFLYPFCTFVAFFVPLFKIRHYET